MRTVAFRSGDEPGTWGHIAIGDNGPSGSELLDRLLDPLHVDSDSVWFTDVVNRYYVHRAGPGSQGYALDEVFGPFAQAVGIAAARLPTRPSRARLVNTAVAEHGVRLRAELVESGAPLVVSLGEEARRTLARIADGSDGEPTQPLTLGGMADGQYGFKGTIRILDYCADWIAIVHPFQSVPAWRALHAAWIVGQANG